jgi:diacylglycerol kinase family enzyme
VLQTIILNHEAPRLKVIMDQEAWEDELLLLVLCNGAREGGGFFISPQARPDDGIFHFTGITHVSRLMMLRLLPEVMRGTHGRFRQVRMGTFHQMTLEADRPLYIHTDGEIFAGFGVDVRHLELEILPGAIEVVV